MKMQQKQLHCHAISTKVPSNSATTQPQASGAITITNIRPFFICVALLSTPLLATPIHAQPAAVPAEAVSDKARAPLSEAELEPLFGGPPTTVTLSGQNLPLRDIIAALAKAFGGPLKASRKVPASILDKTFDIDWKNSPFWQAVAQVETMTGYHWANLTIGSQSTGLELRPPNSLGGSADLSGVVAAQTPYFLILGQSISRSLNFELPLGDAQAPKPKNSISLKLLACADPKVTAFKSTLVNCRFQLGRNGSWTNMMGMANISVRSDPINSITLLLPSHTKPGTVISRLTGTYRTELVREWETWKVPDILAEPTASGIVAGTKLTLEGAKFEGDDLKVVVAFRNAETERGMLVHKDILDSLIDAKLNDSATALQLTDSAGQVLLSPLMDSKLGKRTDGLIDVQMTLTFTATQKGEPIAKGPVALEWSLPTLLRSYDVPFELKDLMVP